MKKYCTTLERGDNHIFAKPISKDRINFLVSIHYPVID